MFVTIDTKEMTMTKTNRAAATNARKLAFNQIAKAAMLASSSNKALADVAKQAGLAYVAPLKDGASDADKHSYAKRIAPQKAIEAQIIYGYMAGRLDGQNDADRLEYARSLVEDHAGKDAKELGKKKGRRTAAQEALYAAARNCVSRIRRELGLAASDKRGASSQKAKMDGRNEPKPGANKPDKAPDVKLPRGMKAIPASPKFKDALAVHAHIMMLVQMAMTTVNQNAAIASNRDKTIVQDALTALKAVENNA